MEKKEKKDVKMIDFTSADVERIDGTVEKRDFSKFGRDIAEIVYNGTTKLGVKIACQEIYQKGKCGYSEELAGELKVTIEALLIDQQPIGIVLKEALLSCIG